MTDYDIVRLLNHLGQHTQATVGRCIDIQYAIATFGPLLNWCVDGLLHVGAIEIDRCALGEIIKTTRESQDAVFC